MLRWLLSLVLPLADFDYIILSGWLQRPIYTIYIYIYNLKWLHAYTNTNIHLAFIFRFFICTIILNFGSSRHLSVQRMSTREKTFLAGKKVNSELFFWYFCFSCFWPHNICHWYLRSIQLMWMCVCHHLCICIYLILTHTYNFILYHSLRNPFSIFNVWWRWNSYSFLLWENFIFYFIFFWFLFLFFNLILFSSALPHRPLLC